MTVTDTSAATYTITYGYETNSMLATNLTFKQGSTGRVVTSKKYDPLNRLTSIFSVVSGSNAPSLPVSFSYLYNQANQRTRADLEDGSFWIYQYDALGQVTSGRRYWADGTQVEGQQFDYGFDNIGNRTTTGGRASASSQYTANRLNQYTQRTVAAYADILGIANPTAGVTVNGNTADRKGEYFAYPLYVNNSSAAQYQAITVISSYGATQTNAGKVFVPKTPEQYSYDADGNVATDGRWTYSWDGENRLVQMIRDTDSPSGAREKLVFEYDYQGRRIRKQLYLWNGSSYVLTNDLKFVYDGWNLMAELNGTNNTVIEGYVWGTDLSGSMQGAGAVGGLLKVTDYTGNTTHHFVAFGGNGNVAALVDASSGAATARYEFGPFGEPTRSTGTMSRKNPIRFSTKFTDNEPGLLYYGYRYYNASSGRWLSRDPVGETGGRNLYSFVGNSGIGNYDPLGLVECAKCKSLCGVRCKVRSGPSFTKTSPITATKNQLGMYAVSYSFTASFEDGDPTRGESSCAGCCEIRLYIKWSQAVPPPGLKGKPDTYVEDGQDRKHYGRRAATDTINDDYFSPDRACGTSYAGTDDPQENADYPAGKWTYQVKVIDACNDGKVVAISNELVVIWPGKSGNSPNQ